MNYKFKGYNWIELAECWGIEVGYDYLNVVGENADEMKELLKSPESIEITKYINGTKMVFTTNNEEEVLAEKVRRHILSSLDKETGDFKDKQIRIDLNEFLKALIIQSKKVDYAYPIYEGILAVEDDDTLARWICNSLESLWS
ncbi:hypothetical protein ACIQZI_13290 [Peribacillus sp. NPDC096379]|uniref:hypothetical protein n=1 Tax=Peribacillus sp. NPDC096379 TaxID=3364393 RepID=UPI00382D0774